MTLDDELRVYRDALRWVGQLMAATPEEAFAGPTPCEDFDVRALMGHLIGTAERSLGTAEGRSTREIPHVVLDVGDAELAGRYVNLRKRLSTAWTCVAPDQDVMAPWGPCSAKDALRGFTIETLVHGWDLAVATAQPVEAPDGLVGSVSTHVDRVIPEGIRARMYDAASAPDESAGPTERLAYTLGHRRYAVQPPRDHVQYSKPPGSRTLTGRLAGVLADPTGCPRGRERSRRSRRARSAAW